MHMAAVVSARWPRWCRRGGADGDDDGAVVGDTTPSPNGRYEFLEDFGMVAETFIEAR